MTARILTGASGYAAAVVAVVLATVASLGLDPITTRIPFALYFAAVVAVARFAGLGPALLASGLSLLAADYFIFPPRYDLKLSNPTDLVALLILGLVAILIGSATAHLRSARAAEQARHEQLQATLAAHRQAVDELERSRTLLVERERQYRRLAESGVVGVIFWELSGGILDANDLFLAMVGYTREDLEAGRIDWRAMTPEEHRAVDEVYVAQLLERGLHGPYEKEYLRKNGSRVPVLVGSALFEESRERGISFVLDLTERKQLEDALRRRERQFATIVERSPDVIFRLDPDLRHLYISPSVRRESARSPEEFIGKTGREVGLAPEACDAFEAACRKLLTTGRERSVEYSLDGSVYRSRLIPEAAPDGTVESILGVTENVTEQHEQERLRQEFISMIGHELRNPLASLKGYAQLMRRRGAYDERGLGVIIAQADQLERRIAELTDFTRLAAGRLTLDRRPTDLVELLHTAAEQARGQSDHHAIRVEAPPRPLVGSWDPDRLGQVVSNLLSNAIKYSPSGGEVLVRAEDRRAEALVSIRDEGLGIAPDHLPRLFDRFYRVQSAADQASGLGLGLYIVREMVEAHGGQIWAESPGEGRGTTFSFTLPYAGGATP